MALTRIGQITGELQSVIEFSYTDGTHPVNASTKAYTGTRSWRCQSNTGAFGFALPPTTTQIKSHFFINHDGHDSTSYDPKLFDWTGSLGNDYVYWDATDSFLKLNVNGVVVDTISAASAGFSLIDTWHSVGISLYTDASAGFVSVYINGVSVLNFSGNTGTYLDTLSTADSVNIYGGWSPYAYIDDWYVDDATGEANSLPEAKRFLLSNVTSSNTSEWTNTDGDSINNYTYVDDIPNDGDTSYVSAASSGLKDDFGIAGITVPSGYKIDAAIPVAVTKNTQPGPEIKLYTYDGTTFQVGDSQSLSTIFSLISERQPLQPDGSSWDEINFDAIKVGIESGGTY
jgi:hypothetical protein